MDPEDNKVEEPPVPYGVITSMDQLDISRRYSYADYFRWEFQERVELLRGRIHKMSPAPGMKHQSTSLKLTLKIGNYFEEKPCNVFAALFDVRLPDSKKQKGMSSFLQ
ncbi:Uma2 family endonuclease [Niabella agricola]|uniref:Uma2 family endonuclease n=1 Tax=Niabella agricola TaxID=2891571 RepID=UPI0021050EC3|nr:Uma2 family endonuclease [Niabella agricola]